MWRYGINFGWGLFRAEHFIPHLNLLRFMVFTLLIRVAFMMPFFMILFYHLLHLPLRKFRAFYLILLLLLLLLLLHRSYHLFLAAGCFSNCLSFFHYLSPFTVHFLIVFIPFLFLFLFLFLSPFVLSLLCYFTIPYQKLQLILRLTPLLPPQ